MKGRDLDIQLYFERDTYRHVGLRIYQAFFCLPHTRLEERFADFKRIDNLGLAARQRQPASSRPQREPHQKRVTDRRM